jgi:hypothetical protein
LQIRIGHEANDQAGQNRTQRPRAQCYSTLWCNRYRRFLQKRGPRPLLCPRGGTPPRRRRRHAEECHTLTVDKQGMGRLARSVANFPIDTSIANETIASNRTVDRRNWRLMKPVWPNCRSWRVDRLVPDQETTEQPRRWVPS